MQNESLAIVLVNREVRLVRCTYDGFDKNGTPLGSPGLFKTLETDLKKGDLVIVPTGTRVGFTVVGVSELDVRPDFESNERAEWIVGKLDVSPYQQMLGKERKFIDAVHEADRRAREDKLREQLLGNMSEDVRKAIPVLDLKPEG